MGWTVVLNPDGTTSAWNPGKTKVLHSHSHRPAPGNTPGRIPLSGTLPHPCLSALPAGQD